MKQLELKILWSSLYLPTVYILNYDETGSTVSFGIYTVDGRFFEFLDTLRNNFTIKLVTL